MALSNIIAAVKSLHKTIILPEGNDSRIIQAAKLVKQQAIVEPVLIADLNALDRQTQMDLTIIDSERLGEHQRYAALQQRLGVIYQQKAKTLTDDMAGQYLNSPLGFASLMLSCGFVDGCVAGVEYTTATVLKSAFSLLGTKQDIKTISGAFLMTIADRSMLFADCAVVVEPTVQQLADIAIASASTARDLLGLEPKIAMLSFSTMGSGLHPLSEKVAMAKNLVQAKRPDLVIDGEMQLDVAIDADVAVLKNVVGEVAGQANVLVFPDLNAGNIGYKLVQRLAGAQAIGPILQGIAKPMNDLSRGASVDDIVNMIAVTAMQS